MQAILYYAFMDESGTPGVRGAHFFVVAAIASSDPRHLEKPIRRAFRQALKKFGDINEVKASDFDEDVVANLLAEISEKDVAIFATIVDQRAILLPPKDAEEIYRYAASRTVRSMAERFPRLNLFIDKRYTNARLRFLLEKAIRDELESLSYQNIIIQQENSASRKELQAADAVAWAVFQKHERGDLRFFRLIEPKIAEEIVVQQRDWLKRKSPLREKS